MIMIVTADGLKLSYKQKTVISDLGLQIPAGKTAILGPNGAGKSTLLQAIATAKVPRSGVLKVLGHSASNPSGIDAIRSVTSFLPQKPGYQRGFKVIDHLKYCCWLKNTGAEANDLTETVEAMNLGSILAQRLRTLSGGQLQRVLLAGALVTAPSVLILDEPTGSLDPLQRRSFKRLLGRLPTSISVIYSTHLLDEVDDIADNVVVMQGGQIRFQGTPLALRAGTKDTDDGTEAYARLLE